MLVSLENMLHTKLLFRKYDYVIKYLLKVKVREKKKLAENVFLFSHV